MSEHFPLIFSAGILAALMVLVVPAATRIANWKHTLVAYVLLFIPSLGLCYAVRWCFIQFLNLF